MSYQIHMSASRRTNSSLERRRIDISNPVLTHVEEWIRGAYESGGNVTFDMEKPIEAGRLRSLSMRSAPGQFLLIASIYGDERDQTICWQDPPETPERGVIDVGGDDWDSRWVQTDLSIALRAFKEVFDTGELSDDSLRHMR